MLKRWMAATLLALAPMAARTDAPAAEPQGLGERLAQGYVAPAMIEFQQAAAHMQEALQAACATSEVSGRGNAASAFQRLVTAWSGIEFLRFGPLVDSNRFERIYFWPDPRGITTRQVQAMLAKPAAEIPDAKGLSTHSVALQGLPALEYVLYRDNGLLNGKDAKDSGRESACAYAVAVAGNLEHIGAELVAQWKDGEYASLFGHPGADNALYRDTREVAAEAVKALSTGLQFQTDVKLAPALGASAEQANVRKAPLWRSGLTAVSVKAAVKAMLSFYDAGGYRYPNAQWIDQSIRGELQNAAKNLAESPGSAQDAFNTDDGHRRLVLVTLVLRNAKDLVDQHMAPALGVRIGFNALDGD